MVPAAKRNGVDLFEIAAQENGEAVGGQKTSKHLQLMMEQKQFENNWEMENRNTIVEQLNSKDYIENQLLTQIRF